MSNAGMSEIICIEIGLYSHTSSSISSRVWAVALDPPFVPRAASKIWDTSSSLAPDGPGLRKSKRPFRITADDRARCTLRLLRKQSERGFA